MRALGVALLVCLSGMRPAHAQNNIEVSGLAYVDYTYIVASPFEDAEGDNGFGYRRLYLTTDYTLSDAFSGRVRLEANDGSTTAQGLPAPFVKDLYLRWEDVWAEGHHLVAGISPPPSFVVSEEFWGYRSLEKTIMDRNGIVSSRDFGVALEGRLTGDGALTYGFMVANDNGVRGENDRGKRVYGQLAWDPSERLTFTVGGDYAGYDDERDDGANINAFAGYRADRFRAGAEGFFNRIDLAGDDGTIDRVGVSVFTAARLAETWEAVARFDRVERDVDGLETGENFFLAGLAYQPHPQVRFIPNALVSKESEDDDAFVAGRITLHVDF